MTKPDIQPGHDDRIFLPESERNDSHIVDVLIEERCPRFAAHWTWPLIRPMLYAMLGYRKAVETADLVRTLGGAAAFDYLAGQLAFRHRLHHIDRFPKSGRLIVAVNHPTGLADGVAVWDVLSKLRPDIEFFANADALRVSLSLGEVIIPVEWVEDKRTTAKTKETLRRAKEAFDAEKCIVIFPSGKLARKEKGKLVEKPWFSTIVSLARKQKCPILPLHLGAENSELFYLLSKINGELRDITLFYELLNKKGAEFDFIFGPLISPDELEGHAQEVTDRLKDYVACELANRPDLPFREYRT